MKDLLTIITPVSESALGHPATYALALANLTGSHLTAIIAESECFCRAESDNMQGGGRQSEAPGLTDHMDRTDGLFRSAAQLGKASFTVLRHENGSPSLNEMAVANAKVRDAVILGVHGSLSHPRQGLVEAVLFGSGRPVLLVPPTARPFSEQTILVAWDATRSAVRALHDALPLLVRVGKVVIASVIDDKVLPAPPSGEEVCRYLARWDIDASFDVLERQQQNVGQALLSHALRLDADLLVMGGFGHAREREFLFGSATRDIFQSNLKIPVMLSH
jgi:nucleotide-binding universal stress UspA family protein